MGAALIYVRDLISALVHPRAVKSDPTPLVAERFVSQWIALYEARRAQTQGERIRTRMWLIWIEPCARSWRTWHLGHLVDVQEDYFRKYLSGKVYSHLRKKIYSETEYQNLRARLVWKCHELVFEHARCHARKLVHQLKESGESIEAFYKARCAFQDLAGFLRDRVLIGHSELAHPVTRMSDSINEMQRNIYDLGFIYGLNREIIAAIKADDFRALRVSNDHCVLFQDIMKAEHFDLELLEGFLQVVLDAIKRPTDNPYLYNCLCPMIFGNLTYYLIGSAKNGERFTEHLPWFIRLFRAYAGVPNKQGPINIERATLGILSAIFAVARRFKCLDVVRRDKGFMLLSSSIVFNMFRNPQTSSDAMELMTEGLGLSSVASLKRIALLDAICIGISRRCPETGKMQLAIPQDCIRDRLAPMFSFT